MANSTGLKSLDKIGESPKVLDVHYQEGSDTIVVIRLRPGFNGPTGEHLVSGEGIKEIWRAFRHDIKPCECAPCLEGRETIAPTRISERRSLPHTQVESPSVPASPGSTIPVRCIPKGKFPNEYGHVWNGGGPIEGYRELKPGDPCICGKKLWTLPANPRDQRCTSMDHCYPGPPAGSPPIGTKCFCGRRRWGIDPRKKHVPIRPEAIPTPILRDLHVEAQCDSGPPRSSSPAALNIDLRSKLAGRVVADTTAPQHSPSSKVQSQEPAASSTREDDRREMVVDVAEAEDTLESLPCDSSLAPTGESAE